jgi:hypothetical protein
MPKIHECATWPKLLQAYEHLRTAAMTDWAWEYLRRNPGYRADARLHHRRGIVRRSLGSGTVHPATRPPCPCQAWITPRSSAAG